MGRPIKNLPVGEAPICRCGCCGLRTQWNRRKNRWNAYYTGHRGGGLVPYKNREWLYDAYVTKNQTTEEIADLFGTSRRVINYWMEYHGIPRRSRAESREGRHTGALNPSWKGGIAQWEYSSDWKALARKIRNRDKWTCQDCGAQRKRWGHYLHVHHIDGDKFNNDPANLISLCAECHGFRHSRAWVEPTTDA